MCLWSADCAGCALACLSMPSTVISGRGCIRLSGAHAMCRHTEAEELKLQVTQQQAHIKQLQDELRTHIATASIEQNQQSTELEELQSKLSAAEAACKDLQADKEHVDSELRASQAMVDNAQAEISTLRVCVRFAGLHACKPSASAGLCDIWKLIQHSANHVTGTATISHGRCARDWYRSADVSRSAAKHRPRS